jgi:uncharacterized membrane protein YcaP (DUF421 family)
VFPVNSAETIERIPIQTDADSVFGSTLSTRWDTPRRAIEGKPHLLLYDGKLLPERMRHEEVNASEVYQALRNQGIGRIEDVLAVVLEVDGTFSVIRKGQEPVTALDDVDGTPVRSEPE